MNVRSETPAATPITQEHLANPKVTIALYGPGREGVKKSHHDTPTDDPFYVWAGPCNGTWGIPLGEKSSNVALTGQAKIRWRTKQSGFRRLHLFIGTSKIKQATARASVPQLAAKAAQSIRLAHVSVCVGSA